MTSGGPQAAIRATGLAGAAWGLLLLARGPEVWTRVEGSSPTEADRLALRFLGARHLVQGALQAAAPNHGQRLFVAVDALHVATMLALAAADPTRRRAALVTTAVAGASAAVTVTARAVR